MRILSTLLLKSPAFFLVILLSSGILSMHSSAQTSAWNNHSFSFSRDIALLENMTGATNITFTGSPVESSSSISFGGFNFRFGLDAYSSFTVSPFGFIKLGGAIVSNNPENNTSVIVPLNNGTYWNASYKLTGTAPDRKMVVQFTGVMQPSGEPTSFQVWMYERTGRIQFVYEQLRGYYGYTSAWSYRIFCSTDILQTKATASLKVNPYNTLPTAAYTGVSLSYDSIYANTRYTFQPDTIKPAAPASLTFSNIQPGCLTVNITENSVNESVLMLERADSGTNYKVQKAYYISTPAGSTTYNYAQILLQPFWNYNYRCFASNGFLNSDTINNAVQTLMPQINGIKTVPGDYPSITALLQDAPCKHIGPNLIIELQNGYSFAGETLPLTFGPSLQTRLIQSVTIRPAASTTIDWTAAFAGPLFYVDSVKHVFLDGRPGGTGTTQNLTLYQKDSSRAVVQYTNSADSGGINYCRIIKKSSPLLTYAIVVVPKDYAYTYTKKDVNAFAITNNFISADANTVSDLIYIKPGDTLNARNFIISGNQFSRFRRSALHFEGGGDNLQVSNNRFFQPAPFTPEVYLPYTDAACIALINTERTTVDNNNFGGSGTVWGTGKFRLNVTSSDFSFLYYKNSSLTKKAVITNNKFGNIEINANSYSGPRLMHLRGGDVTVDNNRFGTADSVNSITFGGYFWGIDMVFGTKTVTNNFFSGIQGSYLNSNTSNHSYFITTSFTDSSAFINNDIGGSNNPDANSSTGAVHGIYLSSTEKKMVLRGNNIRGISSKNLSVTAISGFNGLSNPNVVKLEADSNSIHHITAAQNVYGIELHVDSRVYNRISYNNIYALKTYGTVPGPYSPQGVIYGIKYSIYNWGYSPADYIGEVGIYGNKIHSFESLRVLSNSSFSYYAITASCPVTKIYNNEIRLGINSRGQFIDTLTSLNGIYIYPVDHQTFLSDKHYIEHNSIYFGGKGLTGSAISAQYSYNYVSDKNLLTVDNNILNIDRNPPAGSFISPGMYHNFASIKAHSAKNIWYSSTIASTPSLLQAYKQDCGCDSSSFSGNPAFINAAGDSSNYSLHLSPLSKADSAGTPPVLPIANDLDNTNRNSYSPVDIGCYAATPCGNGAFPSITITNPAGDSAQLCSGQPLTISAGISGGTFSSLQWQRNLIDSAGANGTSLTVSRPGNYRVVGKNACGTVASRTVVVSGTAVLPAVTVTASSTSVCNGSPVTFTAAVSNSSANPSFQWKVNGINAGSNSNIFTSSTLINNSQVSVTVTSQSCSLPVVATSNIITITVLPTPVANAGKDTVVCTGTSVQLNGSGGATYLWTPNSGLSNPNIANPVATPSGTTLYVLTVTNGSNNCSSKDTVLVTVQPPSAPSVTISASTTTSCSGGSILFSAAPVNGGTAPLYQWQVNGITNGVSGPIFNSSTLVNNDRITVILTSNSTCKTVATASSNIITVLIAQLNIPQITVSNRVYSVVNPDAGAVYTWQQKVNSNWSDVVPPATGVSYTAPAAGEYRVKGVKGPCTAYSDSAVTGRMNIPNNPFGIYLYPNPAQIYIKIDSVNISQQWETLLVINADGKQVYPAKNISGLRSVVLNIQSLSKGTYIVILRKKDGEYTTLKFVKN